MIQKKKMFSFKNPPDLNPAWSRPKDEMAEYTTKLAQTRSSTTVYYKTCTNTFQYYHILQNLQKHVPVLPYTTKLAQTHSSTTVYAT